MINISQVRLMIAQDGVQATSIARAQLTTKVARFQEEGSEARPIVFGSHRKPQAVVVPFELFSALLDLAEGVPTVPKVAVEPKRSRKKAKLQDSAQIVQNLPKLENAHIGSDTQELLDQIMAKWKL